MAFKWTLHVTSTAHGYRALTADSEEAARKKYQGILKLYARPPYNGEAKITKAVIEAPNGKKTTLK